MENLENFKEEKKRNRRCQIRLKDAIWRQKLEERFPCVRLGTIKGRSQNFTDLTILLNPDFIFDQKFADSGEKFEFISKKSYRLSYMTQTITQKIKMLAKDNPPNKAKIEKMVAEFLETNETRFQSDLIFEKYKTVNNDETKNYVKQRYTTALTSQILSFDTTRFAKRCYVTSVNDHASHAAIAYIITPKEPTAQQLIDMFRDLLTDSFKRDGLIIHCDQTGANVSQEFRHYMAKQNIILSFTSKSGGKGKSTHTNQLAELINKILKDLVATRKIKSFPEEIEFEDLTEEQQCFMIRSVIYLYNNMDTCRNSINLRGYSRMYIHTCKEILREFRKGMNNVFLIGKSGTPKGDFIATWASCVVRTFDIGDKQQELNEKFNIYLPYVTTETLIELQNVCLERDEKRLLFLDKKGHLPLTRTFEGSNPSTSEIKSIK